MLDAAELAQIQSDAAAVVCDKPCVIRAKTTTAGTSGEPIATFASPGVQAVCGIQQPGSTHLANYDYVIGPLATWLVHFPIGTVVNEQDHLVIEGQTLEVQVILTPRSFPALLDVLASEIK
jgi:hypothetical protein